MTADNRTLPPGPLAMPTRGLRSAPVARGSAQELHVHAARWMTFGGATLLTAAATRAMAGAFASEAGPLELLFIGLFALTFGWIALSMCSALAGLVCFRARHWPEVAPGGRVALVMPVYNEDAAGAVGALLAMAKGVHGLGYGDTFEVVILADTNRPGAWARETAAVSWLREELEPLGVPVWYRRRARNVARKAGNIEEFVRRSGGRFESMVILDADSVMAPETLVTLARRMAADPRLALLQTVPKLHGGRGLLPRMQQFAGEIYGPAASRGVAAWSGADGNFWGHNAIIRVGAFAGAAGLPELGGPRPFGGHVMSHDFAEAAWLRRAGWDVRMDPDLGGSYEEGPPTLLDLLARDRRWMQGNFQHAGLLGARGLGAVSRVHLVSGIAGYLAPLLWLAMLAAGAALTVRALSAEEHSYFAEPHQLAPHWPRFDTAAMLGLFVLTAVVLLLPKAVGLVGAMGRELRLANGGAACRVLGSAATELVLSALVAPIAMAVHTRSAIEILLGRDSGWSAQNREGGVTPWGICLRRHVGHAAVGIALAAACLRWAPSAALWAAPILAGLCAAPLLSRASGSSLLGGLANRAGLFRTSEEEQIPAVLRTARQDARRVQAAIGPMRPVDVVADPRARRRHFALTEPLPSRPRGEPDLAALGARAKLDDALDLDEAIRWFEPPEVMALLEDPELAQRASRLPRRPVGMAIEGALGLPSRAAGEPRGISGRALRGRSPG